MKCLSESLKPLMSFYSLCRGAGYEIKSGKRYAFKCAEQKKFIRLRSLGKGYSEDEIKAIIDGKAPQKEVKSPLLNNQNPHVSTEMQVDGFS